MPPCHRNVLSILLCSLVFVVSPLFLVITTTTSYCCQAFDMFNFTSKKLAKIRVVSYNVLSPNLATPASYPTLKPDHLDPAKRLEAVLYKIEQEINPTSPYSSQQQQQQQPSQRPVIVCLQEVSYDWAGALHTFFANRGYHFVTGLYGRPFNGYMGVAMAWPTSWFETVHVDMARLSDTRESWPREDPEDVEVHNQHKTNHHQDTGDNGPYKCFSIFSWLFPKKKQQQQQQQQKPKWDDSQLDPWDYSERRFNVILTATLKEKQTKTIFCVATYHMPCAFFAPQVRLTLLPNGYIPPPVSSSLYCITYRARPVVCHKLTQISHEIPSLFIPSTLLHVL